MLTSRIGLLAVALMACLPFWVPVHSQPIPTFYGEWLAGMLGFVAIGAALAGARRVMIPGGAILAAGLAAIALLQAWSGFAAAPQFAHLFALYLICAAMLAVAAGQLAATVGIGMLVSVLAGAMLVGASITALIALAQPWLPPLGWLWLPPAGGGTLAQTNHFTAYLWLGLASAWYLRIRNGISPSAFGVTALLLTIAVTLAGQRSSIGYLLAIGAIVFWHVRRTPQDARLPSRSALLMAAAFVVAQVVAAPLSRVYTADAWPSPVLRVIKQAEGPSVRFHLLKLGAMGIAEAPLFGHGIGSYRNLAFEYADDNAAGAGFGPAEHAHNLPIQLAVEMGIPVALLVVLAAGAWLKRLPSRAEPLEASWAAAIFAIVGLHSLIEYPLWYGYFLGLLALVVGAFGQGVVVTTRSRAISVVALGVLVWGTALLLQAGRDYRLMEHALTMGRSTGNLEGAKATLLEVPRGSLLAPWLNLIACQSMDPLTVDIADGLTVCDAAKIVAPTAARLQTTVLLWRAGRLVEAEKQLRQIRSASENPSSAIAAPLGQLAERNTDFGAWVNLAAPGFLPPR